MPQANPESVGAVRRNGAPVPTHQANVRRRRRRGVPRGAFGRHSANGSRGASPSFGRSPRRAGAHGGRVASETPEIGRYPANGGRIAPAPRAREWLRERGVSNSQSHDSPQKRQFSAVFLTSVPDAPGVATDRRAAQNGDVRRGRSLGIPRDPADAVDKRDDRGAVTSLALGPRDRPPERAKHGAYPGARGAPQAPWRRGQGAWG